MMYIKWNGGAKMAGDILIYIGSFIVFGWGAAHLFPTRNVVGSFGEISPDNRYIITMECIIEGISLIFIGFLVAFVTYIDSTNIILSSIYWISFGMLNILSVVSLFTGFKNSFIMFKLCPFIFSGSSLLIVIGSNLS